MGKHFKILILVGGAFAVGLFTLGAKNVEAATGDISAVRIIGTTCSATTTTCNGYVAEVDIAGLSTGGTYNFGFNATSSSGSIDSSAKFKLNVTSSGYDTSGNATTLSRTVYGTRYLRKPYPDQATADETAESGYVTVRVVLSDFVYGGETVTADIGAGLYTQGGTPNNSVSALSVTNNSTYTYPKPVGRWAWVPYERVTEDFLLEATIFHRFARNGKPLAAVNFSCVDEHSNTASRTVNDMTVSTREDSAGTDNAVLVYAATMPISGFTQGDVITCNFTAYPWVGTSTALLKSDLVANGGDGYAQPDERIGPFELLNDKSGTYGTPCAVVASTGQASNATTWVYSSCSAAEAAYAGDNTLAYADIGRASQAIKSYNNTNHGHNDPGGGTIKLLDQNYTTPGTASATTLGTQKTWLIVEPASTVSCQTPVINANTNDELMAQKLKYSCISTLTTTGNVFKGPTALTDILWLDKMKINSTEGAPIRYFKTVHATRNTIDAFLTTGRFWGGSSTVKWPVALFRGNLFTPRESSIGEELEVETKNVLGNKNVRMYTRYTNADGFLISDNAVWAFNRTLNDSSSAPTINISGTAETSYTHGIAIVQNVVEHANSAQPAVAIENMGGTDSINNLIYWHNTSRGQRSNVAYASDAGNCTEPLPFFSNWTWKYNIDSNNNRIDEDRSDHGCAADGDRTGNWSMTFMVGGAGNALAVGGGPSWSEPDYWGLFSTSTPGTAGFVSDLSSTAYGGGGGGNGDYNLTESSHLRNIVPSAQAVLPYDIDGNARYNNGNGSIGAYEYVIASSGGGAPGTPGIFIGPVNIQPSENQATLSWDTQNKTSYVIYWNKKNTSDISKYLSSEQGKQFSYTIKNLKPETTYNFVIEASDERNKSLLNGEFTTLKSQNSIVSDASTTVDSGVSTSTAPIPSAKYKFTSSLKVGMKSGDVRQLQKFLNSNPDTALGKIGPGSPGQETDLFGTLTFMAVKKFQTKYAEQILTPNGLKAPTGYVGPFTIKVMNSLIESP